MKQLIALCLGAGALSAAAAAPALADTTYTDPATGRTIVTNSAPQYVSGPFDVVTMPVRMVTAPLGTIFTPASGAVGPATGTLVPLNSHCFVQTDHNGQHTAMCGP